MAKKKPIKRKHEAAFLDLDQDRLDEEWERQPKLYFVWAEKLANARLDLDEAKVALDMTRAELEKRIREDPASFDLEKTTIEAVKSTVVLQPEFVAAAQVVHEAQHKVNVLVGVITALDHRKKALENMVYLHGQNYFSEPIAKDGDSKDELNRQSRRRTRRAQDRS
jgi:hypothetical protein